MKDLRAAAQNAALKLGYSGLKDLQMDVVIGLATGRMYIRICCSSYWIRKEPVLRMPSLLSEMTKTLPAHFPII